MIRALRELIERQIGKAAATGQLSGLAGEGRPLPDHRGEELVDPGLSAAMRMMAGAGAVPEEFPLKKQLDAARAAYPGITDPEARKTAMAALADLKMRYNMARDARKAFFR